MAETIVLDPSEETDGRFELDLTPFINSQGPDFGDAQIDAYMADAQLGQVPVDFRIPNRTISIPLNIVEGDGWTFDELRSALQQKVALWQRQGGVIKRQTVVGPVYADVVNASLKLGGSSAQAFGWVDADAVLTLEAIPDWYGEEVDLSTTSVTSAGELIRVDTPDRGDHPGRVRIVVDNNDATAHTGVMWGIRSRHYSSAATAALAYAAEDLTPLDAASVVTGVVAHVAIGSNWTPVLSTDLDGVGPLTHVGSYRVWAYCASSSTSATTPRVRLAWDVGDLTQPVTNTPVALTGADLFHIVDLGPVRLDPSRFGSHRWRGQIQAIGDIGGEAVFISRVWFQPTDEYAGVLRAPIAPEPGLQDFAARDEFNQSSGNLNGVTAAVGGAWTTSGATTDFAVNSTSKTVQRSTTSDSGFRFARIGSASTIVVRADMKTSDASVSGRLGVLARYVDANNYLLAYVSPALGTVTLNAVVGGVATVTRTEDLRYQITSDAWHTVQLYADSDGRALVWVWPQGGSKGDPLIAWVDTEIATGGDIATGAVGIIDSGLAASARDYDNFAAWVPEPDAVIHAGRSLRLHTFGADRENSGGASYGPVNYISGDLPRLPPPGLEGMPVELLIKASTGNIGSLDSASASLDVQVVYRPSYLFVPDGAPGS